MLQNNFAEKNTETSKLLCAFYQWIIIIKVLKASRNFGLFILLDVWKKYRKNIIFSFILPLAQMHYQLWYECEAISLMNSSLRGNLYEKKLRP